MLVVIETDTNLKYLSKYHSTSYSLVIQFRFVVYLSTVMIERTKEHATREMARKRGRSLMYKAVEMHKKTGANVWLAIEFGGKLTSWSSTGQPSYSDTEIVRYPLFNIVCLTLILGVPSFRSHRIRSYATQESERQEKTQKANNIDRFS